MHWHWRSNMRKSAFERKVESRFSKGTRTCTNKLSALSGKGANINCNSHDKYSRLTSLGNLPLKWKSSQNGRLSPGRCFQPQRHPPHATGYAWPDCPTPRFPFRDDIRGKYQRKCPSKLTTVRENEIVRVELNSDLKGSGSPVDH